MVRTTLVCLCLAFAMGCASDAPKKPGGVVETAMASEESINKPDPVEKERPVQGTDALAEKPDSPETIVEPEPDLDEPPVDESDYDEASGSLAVALSDGESGSSVVNGFGLDPNDSRIRELIGDPEPPDKDIESPAEPPRFKIEMGNTRIKGGLKYDATKSIFSRHMGQLRDCHERGLAKDPNIKGKLTIKLTIDADGNAYSVNITATGNLPATVRQCVTGHLEQMKFPKPDGEEALVLQPLVFEPLAP